jgi:hypothetical protein
MAYQPHWRVRCNGVAGPLAAPVEIFSFGFALGVDLITPAQQAGIATACTDYFSRTETGITPMGHLTEVAFSQVDAGGKQIGDTHRTVVAAAGTMTGGALHPLQVAYRVSLGDGLRGRSHRGGWYVPYPGWAVALTSGKDESGYSENGRDSALTLIRAVNTIAGQQGVVIASKTLGNVKVTQVRVGNALDTIRTRRNALTEVYRVGTV